MYILGLNAYHGDAAACLLHQGRVLAAAEEERFRRVKHWAGFPAGAIEYCLREAGIDLARVQHIAVNSDPTARLAARLAYAARRLATNGQFADRLAVQGRRLNLVGTLRAAFPRARVTARMHRVEHHLAHLASAFYASPFEEAAVLSVDGFGDFASSCWGLGEDAGIRVTGELRFPHSLGIFYQALSQYLGFPHYGDEYKVMGLAPTGGAGMLGPVRELLRYEGDGRCLLNLRYFTHHRLGVNMQWRMGIPAVAPLYAPALEDLLGPARGGQAPLTQRHRDIAFAVQRVYEDVFLDLAAHCHRTQGVDSLALAGGCAFNSVANGKLTTHTGFRRVYIQPAAGDAGGALGAALQVHRRLVGKRPEPVLTHAYLGPAFSDQQIGELLRTRGLAGGADGEPDRLAVTQVEDEAALCAEVADAIVAGAVVGWFQGRMEWGARALGNRSILCDPRRADIAALLNARIKRRESFRPFAPSVLAEAVVDWFEDAVEEPFMMAVHPVRAGQRARIPAVTHVDGSARLHSVTASANPLYYRLIQSFAARTGVPMLLNTSFNENEPIVCRPEDALDCFLRTRMDLLVMGHWLLRREPSCSQPPSLPN